MAAWRGCGLSRMAPRDHNAQEQIFEEAPHPVPLPAVGEGTLGLRSCAHGIVSSPPPLGEGSECLSKKLRWVLAG
jgi:hypothetical protein